MSSTRLRFAFALVLAAALAGLGLVVPAAAAPVGTGAARVGPPATLPSRWSTCSPGAHTLGTPGDRLYPDTGNGGYRSIHTNVDMVYDATTDLFLPGNQVQLTD